MRNIGRAYLGATCLLVAAHPVLSPDLRAYSYLISVLISVPTVVVPLIRASPGSRMPFRLLLIAMAVLTVGIGMTSLGGAALRGPVESVITAAHAILLAAAVALVLRRGRNDIGGVLDVSVAAIAVGGLVWTTLVSPAVERLDLGLGSEIAMLLSVLLLAGVAGALLRLWLAGARLPALGLLLGALAMALVGNVVLARASGTMSVGRGSGVELIFMISYGCVGLAMLHPSAPEMVRPGAAPADRLSTGRLVFLGLALVAGPVAGGLRDMTNLDADGPLLAAGSLLVTPLVMIRVGRLARQRRDAELRLRHQATHDLLTGLPNRAELLARLADQLAAERVAGRPRVVLLFCDLNGFKQVNDRLGHVVGDELLTEVGERIRAGLRAGDTLARYGGDEFLLLCSDDAQQEAVRRLTAHVRSSLERPFRLAGEEVRIGCSVGAVRSDGRLGADELISRADASMYREKESVRRAAASA